MAYDTDKIDDAALAVLATTMGKDGRAWRGVSMDIFERLHQKGLIEDPRAKTNSLQFTEQGMARAEALMKNLFSK